jgi:hypothetical protein
MSGCDELQPSPATCKGSAIPGLQVPRPTHLDGHGLAPDVQIARREKATWTRAMTGSRSRGTRTARSPPESCDIQ